MMMNRSKDLRNLFRGYLINLNKPSTVSKKVYKDTLISFYEWSNVENSPLCFYQIESFERFLNACGITLELYQREIISNLGHVYITCYSGTKDLNIRSSYKTLCESMRDRDMARYNHRLNSEIRPKNVNPPAIILEGCNRMPLNDGTFFG